MPGLRRRTLLRAGGLAALAGPAGCASLGLADLVRVAVSWSATELAAFRGVLAGRGVDDYELIPLGDDIDAALGARTTGRPNVVALPQPGHVPGNLTNLEPLPADIRWHEEYDRIWNQDVLADGPYALPFKLAHASVVWYRKEIFDRHGLRPPNSWDEWLALNDSIVGNPELRVAPLALGAADGWMLAGFFENILLRTFPGTFGALVERHEPNLWASEDVRRAFEMLGTMWGRPGVIAGGPGRALVQQFPDAVLEVFRFHRAAMVVAPSFAESVIRAFGVPSDDVGTFTFPATDDAPLVVRGDFLVLTRPAGGRTRELVRKLAEPGAPIPWIRDTGGFIAANPEPEADQGFYSPTLRRLSGDLRAHRIRFGLSDQLGAVGGREGLQLVLQNFLEAVGDGTPRDEAVRTAMDAMVAAELEAG